MLHSIFTHNSSGFSPYWFSHILQYGKSHPERIIKDHPVSQKRGKPRTQAFCYLALSRFTYASDSTSKFSKPLSSPQVLPSLIQWEFIEPHVSVIRYSKIGKQ
jgi:hypothetical protein